MAKSISAVLQTTLDELHAENHKRWQRAADAATRMATGGRSIRMSRTFLRLVTICDKCEERSRAHMEIRTRLHRKGLLHW